MKKGYQNTLPADVQATADLFGASFTCVVYDGDTLLTEGAYGYADKAAGRRLTLADTFCFSLRASWLLTLLLLRLVEEKKLRLTQKLSDFYPDYPHADKITLLMLARGRSGIPDYLTAVVHKAFDADPAYRALPLPAHTLRERQDAANFYGAEQVLPLIADLPLEFEPDTSDGDSDNASGAALLSGVLEQASGLPLFALCKAYVFDTAGMTVTEGDTATTVSLGATPAGEQFPLPRPEGGMPGTYTTDTASFVNLGKCLRGGGLLSPGMWKRVTRYALTESPLGIDNVDGALVVFDARVLGDSVRLFCMPGSDVIACYLQNEEQTFARIDGRREYLCPRLRYLWEGAVQKLTAPRMARLNKSNIWNALDLRVTPKQEDFVDGAPESIGACLVLRHWKPYLLVDGTRAIGLLVLEIDQKNADYKIGIVLIDRRYQGRGYGRFMLEFAVRTLREAGAKRLSIGVNRENEAARHLYESLGFRPVNVYEGGVELAMEVQ